MHSEKKSQSNLKFLPRHTCRYNTLKCNWNTNGIIKIQNEVLADNKSIIRGDMSKESKLKAKWEHGTDERILAAENGVYLDQPSPLSLIIISNNHM